MTLTPSEHLEHAEKIIADLDQRYVKDSLAGAPEWDRAAKMKLAELHIEAAQARAAIRSAFTQQNIATALLVDEHHDEQTGDPGPWEPTTPPAPTPLHGRTPKNPPTR